MSALGDRWVRRSRGERGSKLPFYPGGLSAFFWSRFQAVSFRAIGHAKQTFNERLDSRTFLAREAHFEPQ